MKKARKKVSRKKVSRKKVSRKKVSRKKVSRKKVSRKKVISRTTDVIVKYDALVALSKLRNFARLTLDSIESKELKIKRKARARWQELRAQVEPLLTAR